MSNPQDPSFAPHQAPPATQYPAPQQQPPVPPQPVSAQPAPPPPGYGPLPAQANPTTTTNTMAIISMIASIVGWFSFGVLCLVGVILGHISLKQLKTSGEGGRPMALAGLIVGYIGIAGWIIGVIIIIVTFSILGASVAASGYAS